MDVAQTLRDQIRAGQTQQLVWLPCDSDVGTLAATMMAMVNATGGTLLAGVQTDGSPQNISDVDDLIDRIIEAALALTPPLIIPLPQVQTLDDKKLIVVSIPSGMPHVYAHEGRYLRRESTENVPLDPRTLRRLMLRRGEMSYETEIAAGASLADIDRERATAYMKRLASHQEQSLETVLVRRGCLIQQGETLRPTRAGILLFGKDPQRFVPGADIAAVRFAGETMGDTFIRQDLTGTLPDQIQQAETFLRDQMRKGVRLSGKMARDEHFEYPLEAARELVINAIAHRDYSISGDNIHLFLFSDRMEVHSPGGLPGPMTLDNLKDERFSRNPVIVQVLADMAYIERLGYGVDRVLELVQQNSLREPVFEERGGGFRVCLYNAGDLSADGDDDRPETADSRDDAIVINGKYRDIPVNARQEAALEYLHRDEHTRITNSDLKAMFPDVHPETIRRDLVALVDKGILEKMGQKRGSYYVLKSSEPAGTT